MPLTAEQFAKKYRMPASDASVDEKLAYFGRIPMKDLRMIAGQSMCLKTSGTRSDILARIRTKLTT